jgi:hypothetical protein
MACKKAAGSTFALCVTFEPSVMNYFFCGMLLLLLRSQAAQAQHSILRSGDLIFQDLDCGGLCDAIEAVTTGAGGRSFSHIGLVCKKGGRTYVIEAIGKDVHLTPVDKFINRQLDEEGIPKVAVYRLQPGYRKLNKNAIRYALMQLHKPYDDAFLYNNGKYYCSELIYDAYKAANGGKPFFRLEPMTFNDPATGQPFQAWKDYYEALGMAIPEGEPGCNPGGLSRSNKLVPVALDAIR